MSLEQDAVSPDASSLGNEEDRFAIEWAENLVRQTIQAVYEDCLAGNQNQIWQVLDRRILRPALTGESPPGYDELTQELGFKTTKEASNRLQTSIRKFNRILRGFIKDYLPYSPGNQLEKAIDDEIKDLRRVLKLGRSFQLNDPQVLTSSSVTSISHAASLFDLQEQQDQIDSMLNNEHHLKEIWRNLLFCPLQPFVLQSLSDATDDRSPQEIPSIGSFHELLQHPAPPLDILKAIKQQAKQTALKPVKTDSDPNRIPYEVNVLLYTTSSALAELRHNIRITRDTDTRILPRLQAILEKTWLDAVTREVLSDWFEKLSSNLH